MTKDRQNEWVVTRRYRGPVPPFVTLCGSTRFREEFRQVEARLTVEGHVVYTCGVFSHADGVTLTPEEKVALDELHKRKIDGSDSIYVINVGGYIGESTASEIAYAHKYGIPVFYREPLEGRDVSAS